MQQTPLRVRVTFRKGLSDGNYGTEVAEVSLEDDLGDDEDQLDLAALLLTEARARVHAELSRSPSSAVRRALDLPRAPQVAVIPDDDDAVPF